MNLNLDLVNIVKVEGVRVYFYIRLKNKARSRATAPASQEELAEVPTAFSLQCLLDASCGRCFGNASEDDKRKTKDTLEGLCLLTLGLGAPRYPP